MNEQYNEETGNFAVDHPVNSDPAAYKATVVESEMDESSVGGAAGLGLQEDTAQDEAALNEKVTHEPVSMKAETIAPFLNREEVENLRMRWNEIQIKFVDEPHSAVQQANALVSEVIEKITRMFTDEHSSVESQWDKSSDASTEDLRKALQRFRSFFNRLVA